MQMPDLSIRSKELEIMDEPDIPKEDIRNALREIETINRLLGGYHIVLEALDELRLQDPLRIMDIGCGGGDMLRRISGWAKKRNKKVLLQGVDLNPDITEFARERSAGYGNIEYKTLNVFDDALLEESADVTTASLFCHHFQKEELVAILKRMHALATKAVIINDLHRHWFAYHSIGLLTRIFAKSRLVRYDAKLSVARAFSRKDWEETLQEAGINRYTLRWKWAWRWQLIIRK